MNSETNTQVQELAMLIIANSGEAKRIAFNALKEMRETRDFAKAQESLEVSNKYLHEAHLSQTQLLTMSASSEGVAVDVLLVHAQDHLMTTMMAVDLIAEMVLLIEENKER